MDVSVSRVSAVVAALLFLMPAIGGAQATQAPAAPSPATQQPQKQPSRYDRIWTKLTEWYEDDNNPVVQRVLFTGRLHHDLVLLNSDQGRVRESNVRRLRMGPRVTLFKKFTFHTEVELNPQERDPVYIRLTDAYLQWNRSGGFVMTLGKQSLPFTNEGATSSRELLTIDRSNLANNLWFPQEYTPGVSVSGRRAPWMYRAGVYSAGAANRELGEFSGGYFTLALVGYDFAKTWGVKEALVTGNYIYQPTDADNTFTRSFAHIASLHLRLEDDVWGIRGDLTAGAGYLGQSNLWAVMVMPFVNATSKLQFVGRYAHVGSNDPRGIRLTSYESRVVSGRGDRYDEAYLGANYYFYGHRLKLQTGVQFAEMHELAGTRGDYDGVSWVSGLRVGW